MIVENCVSFHYVIMSMDDSFREVDVIKDFETCLSEFNNMCGCEGEAKTFKRNECELKYQNLILNDMQKIKQQLLEFNDEFTFNTVYPEQKFLAFISKFK